MYAVIKDGGHQYKVVAGEVFRVQSKDVEVGSTFTFSEVAAVGGDALQIGKPFVAGASVEATVLGHGRGKKIVVRKFRRRKNYKRKQGHRQNYTELRIDTING